MAKRLPSAQARRGDENLDLARNLRDQWKDVIPGEDMESLQKRITMCVGSPPWIASHAHLPMLRTADMRVGLDSKRGLPRMTHVRAYRRYAKETLHIVKVFTVP
jgi:hypothetical protein